MVAEQQRAKSEIEAALTIAAHRPRDQADAVERIITSCQRPALAADSTYDYSRGGTAITGANIRLMEVVAQNWGNIEWGFRELARFPGAGGKPGESVVEAFGWDLETNSRVRRQFNVKHKRDTKGGGKVLREERDIYEHVANMAQRRVRTCLENLIPRDITDAAIAECDKTMKTHFKVTPENVGKMVTAFADIGVTKAAIEAKLQRKMAACTPAQFIHLRKVFASIRDGMSEPGDWFDLEPEAEPKSAADTAKAVLAKKAEDKAKAKKETKPTPEAEAAAADTEWADSFRFELSRCKTPEEVDALAAASIATTEGDDTHRWIHERAEERKNALATSKGELFEKGHPKPE